MGWIESFKICMFHKFFKFSGRASRAEFWKFWFISFLIPIFFNKILSSTKISNLYIEISSYIFHIIFVVPIFSATVRRLHDINESAKQVINFYGLIFSFIFIDYILIKIFFGSLNNLFDKFLGLIPVQFMIILIYFIYFILLLTKKGDPETNKYGEPPILNKTNEARNKKEIIETENN